MRRKLIVANFKMNPRSENQAGKIARQIDFGNVIVAPPFVFLRAIKKVIKRASLGAQDVFWKEEGSYTGEVSPVQLKGMGVKYVIVGHSERRINFGEDDDLVNLKLKAVFKAGLRAILCVGEPGKGPGVEKKGSKLKGAKSYIKKQLEKGLRGITPAVIGRQPLIIAYEPVWAIGTGRSEKPARASEIAGFIKEILKKKNYGPRTKVLYGGSVDENNAERFLEEKEIDGLIIGKAVLKQAGLGGILTN